METMLTWRFCAAALIATALSTGCYRTQDLLVEEGNDGDTDADGDTDEGPGPDTDSGDGDSGGWAMHLLGDGISSADMVFLADLNGDGFPDVVSASRYSNEMTWYENPGPPTGEWTARTISTTSPPSHVHAVDLDLDGDTDLVVSSSVGNTVSWLENGTGAGTTWIEELIDDQVDLASCVVSVSHCEGEYPFVIATSAWTLDDPWENSLDLISYSEGAIDGLPWMKFGVDYSPPGLRTIVADRLGGEGSMVSLLGVDTEGALRHWDSVDALDQWAPFETYNIDLNEVSGLDTGDFDGDGDVDAVAFLEADSDVLWVENTFAGGGQGWVNPRSLVGGTGGFAASGAVRAADMNSDGYADVVGMSGALGEVVWWENSGGGGTTWIPYTVVDDLEGLSYIDVGDLDLDGDPDVVLVESDFSEVSWLENPL